MWSFNGNSKSIPSELSKKVQFQERLIIFEKWWRYETYARLNNQWKSILSIYKSTKTSQIFNLCFTRIEKWNYRRGLQTASNEDFEIGACEQGKGAKPRVDSRYRAQSSRGRWFQSRQSIRWFCQSDCPRRDDVNPIVAENPISGKGTPRCPTT